MPEEMKQCPQCHSLYGYSIMAELYACPECSYEWNPNKIIEEESLKIVDINGNQLVDGDSVVVIKDLHVKGAPKPVKAGIKVKNIRLAEGNHNINCKSDGFDQMSLKSEFVKKA